LAVRLSVCLRFGVAFAHVIKSGSDVRLPRSEGCILLAELANCCTKVFIFIVGG